MCTFMHGHGGARNQFLESFLKTLIFKNLTFGLPVSVSGLGPSSATVHHIQVVKGGTWSPRSVERPDSTGRTSPAAQSKQLETLRSQEPRSSLEQESSDFPPQPELIKGYRATYKNTTTRELFFQEYLHTCAHREQVSQEHRKRSFQSR